MRALPAVFLISSLSAAACAVDRPDPAAPSLTNVGPAATLSASNSWGPETPPFNFEAILRNDAGGFGHVKVRQPNDGELVFHLDTWVRDLAPNTRYRLQRAVDTNVDDVCVGTAWLTLGLGPTPLALVTDDQGTGRAPFWRVVTSPIGTKFDVHFRVIIDGTTTVALESDCYQFVITQ